MYNNYDFEAEFPLEKAVQKFLVSDYFHDSEIRDVELDQGRHELIIHLQCSRDWEALGEGSLDDARFTYILRFFGVYGFRSETELRSADYINGRFKHTAWLNERQRRIKQKLYQFRIGLSDGYIDFLFSRFSVRKAIGRISYRDIKELGAFYKEWYHRSPEQLREIRRQLREDPADRICALYLEFLYANGVEDLLPQCRSVIAGTASSDAKVYAAWLLGKCGTQEDLQLIWDIYRAEAERKEYEYGSDDPMKYRNLLDAIEQLDQLL